MPSIELNQNWSLRTELHIEYTVVPLKLLRIVSVPVIDDDCNKKIKREREMENPRVAQLMIREDRCGVTKHKTKTQI